MAIGRQYELAQATKFLLSSGGSPANQDTQRIATDDDVVVVCLNPESSAVRIYL